MNDSPTMSPDQPTIRTGRHRRRSSIRHLLAHRTSRPRHRGERRDSTRAARHAAQMIQGPSTPPAVPRSGDLVARCERSSLRRLLLRLFCAGVLCALVSFLVCGPASGAAVKGAPATVGPMLAVNDLPTVVNNATKWLVGILATLATFFLTLGGARYLAAGGDPSQVEQAKGSFKNAGIGYALAVLAPVFLKILQGILGVTP